MRVYREKQLKQLYCNNCGKEIKVQNEMIQEGVLTVDFTWGYFSDKDNSLIVTHRGVINMLYYYLNKDPLTMDKKKYNVIIGERTAEDLKINIGCVYPKIQDMEMDIRGRDLATGLPKTLTVHSSEMLEALIEPAMMVIDAVHGVLEKTPPELAADISDRGIYMTGGGCLIDGLDKLLQEKTGINVMIAQDAISCVALGTGKALDNLDVLDAKKRR